MAIQFYARGRGRSARKGEKMGAGKWWQCRRAIVNPAVIPIHFPELFTVTMDERGRSARIITI